MDTSPTALFDSYEQDFKQLIQSLEEKLQAGEDERGEDRKASLRRVEMELEEADEMVPFFILPLSLVTVNLTTKYNKKVSQLDIEVQSIPQSVRAHYHTRLREAKAQLSKSKKALVDARSSLARADLLSSSKGGQYASSDDPYGASSDRTRLLAGSTILENGTKRLEESQRMALETENQGAEILTNLRQQREQIENSRDTLHRADLAIDRASSTLKQMVRRMYQQRAITYSIIAVLIIIIVVVVWEKLS
ncbi:hypothetical protein EST38_g3889 [Candolleomyces aberdarensis]|uniref:t-SNARE coiled-coil homology domain-containing protein n=1 Tax=Candolleomyces aberdarensis TaxID=2316362 RepID=A0A4Q2DSC9_9AGAR|nr:hypothetical protein EST38_g3889 [Candolleomyces aberdarensis]